MSTLKLENIKHENSSTNNMVMNSDGSVSVTGDLAVDTNTLKVDATNNHVGFGTATPQAPIDATLAAGGDWVARFQNTTSATPYGVQIYDAPSASNGYPLLQVTNSAGSGAYLRADSGTGYVTMPQQPGCSYLSSKQYVIAATGTQVMNSSNVWASNVNHGHNRGSHFNASTGRFTCPVAGRYMFIFTCQSSDFGSGYLYFYMRLNQSTFSYSQKSQQNTWTSHIHHAIMELNANDYVDMTWTNNYVSGQIHMPGFTGQLIS